MQMCTREAL